MRWIPGLDRLKQREYSDLRDQNRSDPDREKQPELDWYHERYYLWRSLFDGSALEEKLSSTVDPGEGTDQDEYRWPVRFNMIRSYCKLYAALVWGRGKTGAEADDLFDIRVQPDAPIPGRPGPAPAKMAKDLAAVLNYFWSHWQHILRPASTIQQWSGGCAVKVAWNPWGPASVYGVELQTIQPEHFYPIWDPLNFESLIAAKVKFSVGKAIALENYGLTKEELEDFNDRDSVPVEEYWDRTKFYVRVGKGKIGPDRGGIVAKDGLGQPLEGDNPFRNPLTLRGIVPIVYIPRQRVGGFFGDSLAYSLEGLQNEVNKTLADYGDALTRGTHPAFGVSDFHGKVGSEGVIMIPRHGALNLGKTPPGRTAPKIHNFPQPAVPPQTPEFTNLLLSLGEQTAGLTPAARGTTVGAKSQLAMAMEMLPTLNDIDWQRSHWSQGITGKQGIDEIIKTIWYNKQALDFVPKVEQTAFWLKESVEYRPVIPRDRIEVVDEVTRLLTAKAISPWEALERLGDVQDMDLELKRIEAWLVLIASIDAAVAGRRINLSEPSNEDIMGKEPAKALPQVSGETDQPATKQPAKQPEGLKTSE